MVKYEEATVAEVMKEKKNLERSIGEQIVAFCSNYRLTPKGLTLRLIDSATLGGDDIEYIAEIKLEITI